MASALTLEGTEKLYCFDFDDTLVYTDSYIRALGGAIVSTTRYAQARPQLEPEDPFRDFRNVESVRIMKGPSYRKFARAVSEGSPISIVTARDNDTKQFMGLMRRVAALDGLQLDESRVHLYLCNAGNFTDIIPEGAGSDLTARKCMALRHFLSVYPECGSMGFSDDDPKNIESVRRLFLDLQVEHPEKIFKLYPMDAQDESPFGSPASETEVDRLRSGRSRRRSPRAERSRSPAPRRA